MSIPIVNDRIDFTEDKLCPIEGTGHVISAEFGPSLTIPKGQVVAQVVDASVNEVQTINTTGTYTAGTFTLTIFGKTTAALAYNISNANLKTAIENLLKSAGIVGGTVTISNGPMPADTTITFGGTLAGVDVPMFVIANSMTGGTSVAMVETTKGSRQWSWAKYDDAQSDGRNIAKGVAKLAFVTDEAGRVSFGSQNATGLDGAKYDSAPIYVSGRFKTTELTGLDANGIADLGRLESGTLADGVLLITGS